MTDEQIDMLRRLIQDEIEVAGVDGMEHGVWGWMDSQLDKRWKQFQESFNEEQALKALDKLYQENDNGMKELAKELMKQGEGTVEKVPTEHRKAGADAL